MGFKDKPFIKMNKVRYYNSVAKKYIDADTMSYYEILCKDNEGLDFVVVPFTDGNFVKTVVCTSILNCNELGIKPVDIDKMSYNLLGTPSYVSMFLDYYILTGDVTGLDIMEEDL